VELTVTVDGHDEQEHWVVEYIGELLTDVGFQVAVVVAVVGSVGAIVGSMNNT